MKSWKFNNDSSFSVDGADKYSDLYFPLANERGIMSSITPNLNGDLKTGQNSFALLPVSVEDLRNSKSSRNFWLNIEGYGPWSATGCSALQESLKFTDITEKVSVDCGFLWHR